jgi:predicted RNase H-like HicB family nuclease
MKLENIVWREGNYYVAKCLNVEVSSFGESKTEALSNLDEALELYFEDNTAEVLKIDQPELFSLTLDYA